MHSQWLGHKQSELPDWFRINMRYLKGVDYVCNAGFTRASAQTAVTGSDNAAKTSGMATVKKSSGTAASMVVSGVLAQIDRILSSPHWQAEEELRDLLLPEHEQSPYEEPVVRLTLSEHDTPEAEGHAGESAKEYKDTFADQEDDDDFVFESLDQNDSAQQDFLSSLLPPTPTPATSGCRASAAVGGWDHGEATLRKLVTMASFVTYSRVASDWQALDVKALLLRIVRRLLELPPGVWQQDDEDGGGDAGGADKENDDGDAARARRASRGASERHAAASLMLRICFLLRDRCSAVPQDAGLCICHRCVYAHACTCARLCTQGRGHSCRGIGVASVLAGVCGVCVWRRVQEALCGSVVRHA
jgi:hypothetical protein